MLMVVQREKELWPAAGEKINRGKGMVEAAGSLSSGRMGCSVGCEKKKKLWRGLSAVFLAGSGRRRKSKWGGWPAAWFLFFLKKRGLGLGFFLYFFLMLSILPPS